MYANAAGGDVGSFFANAFNLAGDFVPERYRQIVDLGNSAAVMRIGVTNPGCRNTNQNVLGANFRDWNVFIFQRLTDLNELYCSHQPSLSLVTRHLSLLLTNQRVQLFQI